VGLKCDEESESMSNKPNLTIFQAFSGLANSPIDKREQLRHDIWGLRTKVTEV
jgi:hypothetical protein